MLVGVEDQDLAFKPGIADAGAALLRVDEG